MSEMILLQNGIYNPTCSKALFTRFADIMPGACLGCANSATRRCILQPTEKDENMGGLIGAVP